AAGYRQVKVLEFFDCSSLRQGVDDLKELLHKGAQGGREAEVFQVSNDDTAVTQRRLEDKQPEEKTNMDCLRSTQQCTKSGVAKHLGVAVIQQQNRFVKETNVTLLAKVVLYRNMCYDESGKYKKTFISSSVASSQEVQTQDLIYYHLARDREQHLACELFGYREDSNGATYVVAVVEKIYAHESLTFNNTVVSTVAGNAVTTSMAITEGIQKGLLAKAKENILSMEIVMDHSGNTLRVSQSRDCDVEKNGKWSCIYAVRSQEYQMVCTRLDIASADVGSLKANFQHMEALLTTEAGYMTFMKAVKEAIWLKGLLEDLGVELNRVTVNCDNQGAIHLSRNHVFHERTKHINVRYHFIREVLEAKTDEVLKVGTEHNAADALTKVVPGHKLQHCLELLSVSIG
nr:retrovirus-related Pol polyprotein from transposon TNT 1-94 [Tanacetum cinerariifolium]